MQLRERGFDLLKPKVYPAVVGTNPLLLPRCPAKVRPEVWWNKERLNIPTTLIIHVFNRLLLPTYQLEQIVIFNKHRLIILLLT